MAACRIGQELLHRAVAVVLAHGHLVRFGAAHHAEVLGQQHQLRAAGGGLGDQRLGARQVGIERNAGDGLHGGHVERGGGGHGRWFPLWTLLSSLGRQRLQRGSTGSARFWKRGACALFSSTLPICGLAQLPVMR
ncbi:hypothetical protein D9M68_952880 [compost metagenome]